MKRSLSAALVGACLVATVAAGSVTAAAAPFTVVADGLWNPRGLAFGPSGTLYVAEAGLGGGTAQTGAANGFGSTGRISAIRGATGDAAVRRTLRGGLPSAGDTEGIVGPAGISVRGNGNIKVIISLSQKETGLPSNLLGREIKLSASGQMRVIANVGDFNYAWSADHQSLAPHDFPDSNPYGILAVPGGAYVADAGTNTLNWVGANGQIKVLAYFPLNAIADATPTCIAKGPDGALYVGILAFVDSLGSILDPSLPPPHPAAIVYRVDPSAVDPSSLSTVLSVAKVWATGLWPITGCASDGSKLYVSEFATGIGPMGPVGDVVSIPFSNPSSQTPLTNNALTFPGGVAVGPDHKVYVSNLSTSDHGQVVRIN
jgi:hypothetical protein